MSPVLQVRDLSVDFRYDGRWTRVLGPVSLDVGEGDVVGVVGESGCGKTVLSLAIMGLLDRSRSRVDERASIQIGELEVSGLGSRALNRVRGGEIAMVFQEPMTSLNPAFTVGHQIAEAVRIHEPMGRRAARRRAEELLAEVGIPHPRRAYGAYPHAFSGGMRQRVLIAMAISCSPKVLIADEPTTALDVTVQAQILELLRRMRDDHGLAVIMITHDLGIVADFCDHVAVMYAGQIVERCDVHQLFSSPAHPYTEGLLASMPTMETARLRIISGRVPTPLEYDDGCRFRSRCPYATSSCESAQELNPIDDARRVRCGRSDALRLEGVPEVVS